VEGTVHAADTIPGQGSSIQQRLLRSFLVTSGVVLLLVSAAFAVSEYVRFRSGMVENLSVLGQVVGLNTGASLLFDDQGVAEETLRALKAEPHIMSAVVFERGGAEFASYRRRDVEAFVVPERIDDSAHFHDSVVDLYRDIVIDGETLGSIFIRADTRALTSVMLQFGGIVAVVLALASVACWLGAALMQRRIAAPLAELASGAKGMADGDLSVRVEVEADDEIGTLAGAFNGMVASLSGLVAQVGQNTRAVAEVTQTLLEASDSMHAESSRQEQAVEGSAESIERMTASIAEVSSNVETLADTATETSSAAFQMDTSIREIATHMDALSETIDTTASSVVEMTTAIGEIAQGAETLSSATDTTVASLGQLSQSVNRVESNANESLQLAERTREEADRGVKSVRQTVAGMNEIKVQFNGLEEIIERLADKSQSIGEVVKVIEGVVEQTNLLALNAAIISSHAGEHGRAFAVVAGEVKNLADRTAGSTREIGALIEGVQREVGAAVEAMQSGGETVGRGVNLSNEAGRILEAIGSSAEESASRVSEIVSATSNQARDIQKVDAAMQQVKDIVVQLNRGTHEQDSASTEITRGVERMRQLGQDVKRSTQEQSKESRLITESVKVVAGRINQILDATKVQTKQSEQILEALSVFREVTEESGRRAEGMKGTVGVLSERASALEEEIGRFHL